MQVQLGDIVKLSAPGNAALNDKSFIIIYLDVSKIRLRDINTGKPELLTLDEETQSLNEKSIKSIILLDRDDKEGYARQNGLLPGKWINVFFGGDVPQVITCQITDLEEDMIELKVFPSKKVIYIDFRYNGIPEDFLIEKIELRDAPQMEVEDKTKQKVEYIEDAIALDDDFITSDDTIQMDQLVKDQLIDADQIEIGDDLQEITQFIQLDESRQRYSLETQTNDLLDEMLSTIPNARRTPRVFQNIRQTIERFVQLRDIYSDFDENGNISQIRKHEKTNSLVEQTANLASKNLWIIPTVKVTQKLYNDDTEENIDYAEVISVGDSLSRDNVELQNAAISSGENTFEARLKVINEIFSPFSNQSVSSPGVINTKAISDDTFGIIDNIDNLKTHCIATNGKENEVIQSRFVLQQFNTSLSKTKTCDTNTIAKVPVAPPEQMSLTGVLMLPSLFIRKSEINHPLCPIYDVIGNTLYDVAYSEYLKKNTNIDTYVVEALDMDRFKHDILFSRTTHFILDEHVDRDEFSFKKFLSAITPSITDAMSYVKNVHKKRNILSVPRLFSGLSPFALTSESVSFKDFKVMMEFIEKNIINFKKKLISRKKIFGKINGTLKRRITPQLLGVVTNKSKEILDVLSENNLTDLQLSTSEYLNRFHKPLYITLVNQANISLHTVDDVQEHFTRAILQGEASTVQDNDCVISLAKKYSNIAQLQNDNHIQIYYDKALDPTRYEIVNEHKNTLSSLTDGEKREYLVNHLLNEVGLSQENAINESTALLQGARIVRDDAYALLTERDRHVYYKREGGMWVKTEEMPNTDDAEVLCNIKQKCIPIRDSCISNKQTAANLRKSAMSEIVKEFDKAFIKSKDELKVYYENRIAMIVNTHAKHSAIRRYDMFRTNDMLLGLAKQYIGTVDIVISPHTALLDRIMAQSDFVKKQQNILRFCAKYTRGAIPTTDENEFWRYCLESNVKIIPSFIYSLAVAFNSNKNYLQALDEICRRQGTISDNGDSWVDRHSGYKIKSIEFASETGGEEGGLVSLPVNPGEFKTPGNDPATIMVHNVVKTMSGFMGVQLLEEHMLFIVKHVVRNNQRTLPSKMNYEAMVKQEKEMTTKKRPKYEELFNSSLLLMSLAYMLITIQSAIPNIKPKKQFPGCVRSFDGWPLNPSGSTGQNSIAHYIACVAFKIKSKIPPWNTLHKQKEETILKKMVSILSDVVLKESIVQDMLQMKRTYLDENAELLEIPPNVNIHRWDTFLPPLKLGKTETEQVSEEFMLHTLLPSIKHGRKEQHQHILTIESKLMANCLSVVNEINQVVRSKQPILTNAMEEPFVENACCNDRDEQMSTIAYFRKQNQAIQTYEKTARYLSTNVEMIRALTKPSVFISRLDKTLPLKNTTIYSENTIFAAFIKYCNLNTNTPIPDGFSDLCGIKLPDMMRYEGMHEQIEYLKQDGRKYDLETFMLLLKKQNERRTVVIDNANNEPHTLSKISGLRLLLSNLEKTPVPSKLVELLEKLVDSYEPYHTKESISVSNSILNYISEEIGMFREKILRFLTRYSRTNKKQVEKLGLFFDDVVLWKNTTGTVKTTSISEIDNESTPRIMHNISNWCHLIVNVFPTIIQHRTRHSPSIPKHWMLSSNHEADISRIISASYAALIKHFGTHLDSVNDCFVRRAKDVLALINTIPYHMNLNRTHMPIFNSELSLMLAKYCFCSLFTIYIDVLEHPESCFTSISSVKGPTETDIVITSAEEEEPMKSPYLESEERMEAVAEYIITLCTFFDKQKQLINVSYKDITDKASRAKDEEKDVITKRLKDLSDEAREIDTLQKKHKLGEWNLGLQKGLTQYVPEQYDKETAGTNFYPEPNDEAGDAEAEADLSLLHLADDDDYGTDDGDEFY